jgi:hypothetical protein
VAEAGTPPTDEHGDERLPTQSGRHYLRDSQVDEAQLAIMREYTERVTEAVQQVGAQAAAASDVAADIAAKVAEHTAKLISKQAVTRTAWKWLGLTVGLVTVLNLGASALAWNEAADSIGRASAVAAKQAAYIAVSQRAQANVAQIRTQIDSYNKRLIAQGKPPVPLPTNPADASAQLSYAKTELLLVPQVIQGPPGKPGRPGTPGQPPLSWVARNPDGSIETCLRAGQFDLSHPNYVCSVASAPARVAPPPMPR